MSNNDVVMTSYAFGISYIAQVTGDLSRTQPFLLLNYLQMEATGYYMAVKQLTKTRKQSQTGVLGRI
jgi:hypothetical protein